ncbi:MAG: hypothetical protein SGI88_02200 [Candidatus Hydrogenedentes bacterium]|nr:hypothetical protein [Candidatus Hydrogenedentota bacterium]
MGYILLLILVVGAVLAAWVGNLRAAQPKATEETALSAEHAQALGDSAIAEFQRNAIEKSPLPAEPSDMPVYVALRSNGLLKGRAWAAEQSALDSVRRAVAIARDEVSPADEPTITTIEICITHNYRLIAEVGGARMPQSKDVGILGLQIAKGQKLRRFAPTEMIARNLPFEKALTLTRDDWAGESGLEMLRAFDAHQIMVDVPTGVVTRMYRGNTIVPFEHVTRDNVRTLGDGLLRWMQHDMRPDGSFKYKYWPSRGEYSDAANTIRELLGTIALSRWARHTNDGGVQELARRNLGASISAYYRAEDGLGSIIDGNTVKLGAVGLAALAIMESPDRAQYAEQEAALLRTMDHLWNADTGEFRTFLRPPDRNDNENFYPGEALLAWGTLYSESKDPALLAKIMKAFTYYRDWHRKNRNPAFVPWHTQAYALVYLETRDESLRDFIFEMNDWLVTTQQWDDAPYPDMKGRFYSPDFKGYGPPHASSTGVYMEGLVAAYRVAVAAEDAERVEQYRTALRRGMRSIMQLQFSNAIDLFYVSKRDIVTGGIRTTEHNNELRIDNAAHNLLAVAGALSESNIFD